MVRFLYGDKTKGGALVENQVQMCLYVGNHGLWSVES